MGPINFFWIEMDTEGCRLPSCRRNQVRPQDPLPLPDARQETANAGIFAIGNVRKYVWEVDLHDSRHCLR